MEKERTIALLSQPNAGKSTLFNGLTGSRQHVGNWPGKTVEKKEGHFYCRGSRYTIIDLPGTYSLSANSNEEIVTRDYIASGKKLVYAGRFCRHFRSGHGRAEYDGCCQRAGKRN